MSGLAVLLLAAPTFGLTLHAPSTAPLLDLSVNMPALLAAADPDDEEGGSADGDTASSDDDESAAASEDDASSAKKSDDASAEEAEYNAEIKRRNSLIKIHRPLGIATWVAMTAALTLGTIQYYNLYGFGADIGHNPCVTGDAIFGQEQCSGTPWPHLVAAGVTTALYATTFTISLMMPDPDDLANGKGEFASTLRLHKLLRWIHFSGMVAQVVLGIVIANAFDRANDYDTLQILATAHLASGIITYGALTWAGALMTF
jgi:hypothetical protein